MDQFAEDIRNRPDFSGAWGVVIHAGTRPEALGFLKPPPLVIIEFGTNDSVDYGPAAWARANEEMA